MCPDIPGALDKLNDSEVAQDAPVTEALLTKIGANINQLIDDNDEQETDITDLEASLNALISGGFLHARFGNGSLTGSGFSTIDSQAGIIGAAVYALIPTGGLSTFAWGVVIKAGQTVNSDLGGTYQARISGNNLQISAVNGTTYQYVLFYNA